MKLVDDVSFFGGLEESVRDGLDGSLLVFLHGYMGLAVLK